MILKTKLVLASAALFACTVQAPPSRTGAGVGTARCGEAGGASAAIGQGAPSAIAGYGLGSLKPAGQLATLRLRDTETGVVYDPIGRPILSNAAPLKPVAGYNQFWFAWSVFNDGSEIFNRDHHVATGPLIGDDECAVPCQQIQRGCPGKDCIPALTNPQQVSAAAAEKTYLADTSLVVGVSSGGEARAYPHNVLWWHEIVNDSVGGKPVAITHCPLTFSSIGHDPAAFVPGQTVELGVSGRLFNSNLVFYNRSDDTWFSQLLGKGTRGAALGKAAPRVHVWEMTWAAWKAMFPNTTALTDDTGHARNYQSYPYGGYFVDPEDTFSQTSPAPDPTYPAKSLTYGLRTDSAAKAYAHCELSAWSAQHGGDGLTGVVNDRVGSTDIAVVFDIDAGYVQAFERPSSGELELVTD